MSDEHGWPDLSHQDGPGDHGDPHDAGGLDEPVAGGDGPFHDDLFGHDDADVHGFDSPDDGLDHGLDEPQDTGGDVGWDDLHEPGTGHDDDAGQAVVDVTDGHPLGPVGADPDAAADVEQVSVFPPVVDVGPLPEPVDGFPWIDTGSLGLYHSGMVEPVAAEPVPAEDLAAYAAEDLPPGVDPWAALADSDDPATSTLAKWWQPGS
jgi:hypothetical protein